MGSAVERTDEHVREFLIYRGFTTTLKHLDNEIKADKEKGFRVQRSPHLKPTNHLTTDLSGPTA